MRDLKENIKKNNMKKLVLSAVLGMFCYCTNNAMKKQIEINDVLIKMLRRQVEINKAREEIKAYEKEIYSQINETGKVTKKKVLEFIIKLYTPGEQEKPKEQSEKKDILGDIEILEKYFHLKEIENEHDECSNENLTDIFWERADVNPENDNEEISKEGVGKIKEYFQAIIDAEKAINKAFQEYYAVKKEKNKKAQYEEILKEIMKDCCGDQKYENPHYKFLTNLISLCMKKEIEPNETVEAIKRRIALDKNIIEENFIYFLKQKIGEEKKIYPKGNLLEEEGWCSCCNDCCGKE